jgi:hypothetical protein
MRVVEILVGAAVVLTLCGIGCSSIGTDEPIGHSSAPLINPWTSLQSKQSLLELHAQNGGWVCRCNTGARLRMRGRVSKATNVGI